MVNIMKHYINNLNIYYGKNHCKGGFLLIEVLIYSTLLILLLGMAQLAISKTMSENWQFDRVSRLFYYTIKRTQLLSSNGGSGTQGRPLNTIYVSDSSYEVNLYATLWGYQEIFVPNTMKLVNNSRTKQSAYLGKYDGQSDLYSFEIYDYVLRKYRKYIFSQQTPRIRWIEGTF